MLFRKINEKLDAILFNQRVIFHKEIQMSFELDNLEAEVAADTAIDQSAITLITGLAAQITAAGVDPVKLAALTASLHASAADLAAAVAANTPAAPPAPEPAL